MYMSVFSYSSSMADHKNNNVCMAQIRLFRLAGEGPGALDDSRSHYYGLWLPSASKPGPFSPILSSAGWQEP